MRGNPNALVMREDSYYIIDKNNQRPWAHNWWRDSRYAGVQKYLSKEQRIRDKARCIENRELKKEDQLQRRLAREEERSINREASRIRRLCLPSKWGTSLDKCAALAKGDEIFIPMEQSDAGSFRTMLAGSKRTYLFYFSVLKAPGGVLVTKTGNYGERAATVQKEKQISVNEMIDSALHRMKNSRPWTKIRDDGFCVTPDPTRGIRAVDSPNLGDGMHSNTGLGRKSHAKRKRSKCSQRQKRKVLLTNRVGTKHGSDKARKRWNRDSLKITGKWDRARIA